MDKLREIIAWKRREVAPRIRPVRKQELKRFGSQRIKGLRFKEALANPAHLSVIAEVKRRSPSAGEIAQNIDATEQARKYYNASADAISVLTDEKYFSGNIKDLWAITDLLGNRKDAPAFLRKDFMVHPIQVVEAAEAGARAILIIARAIQDDEIKLLYEAAQLAGLDVLFEIHCEQELEKVLQFEPEIIGVNNRDLGNFTTDLASSEILIPLIPDSIVTVSESGISNMDDVIRVAESGVDAVLIGQSLMESDDPDAFIRRIHELQFDTVQD